MRISTVIAHLAFSFIMHSSVTLVSAAERPNRFPVSSKQMQALDIRVAPLQSKTGQVVASYPAQVMAGSDQEQVVSAPMAGVVVQLLVQQNQAVRQGTPLLRLAGTEFGQQQLQLLQTASRASLARQAAQREQSLFSEGIIPQRRVQETQAALKESEAALAQARAALVLSGMDGPAIDRIAAGGKLESSLTLTAVKAGIVSRLEVKAGQRVEPASVLLHVVQADKLSLDIQVPAEAASRWPPGTQIKLQGRDGSARIVSISPTVSPGSQTVGLRAIVQSGAVGLRAGESVAVELPNAAGIDGWDVPLVAVVHDGAQAFVFVRTADGFEARPVTVAARAGQNVQVQGPLKSGELVAVSGLVALKGAWMGEKGGS